MAKSKENLVDEGFRVSLVETAFFDGKFEIPHINAPSDIMIPNGMVPFSLRERKSILNVADDRTKIPIVYAVCRT